MKLDDALLEASEALDRVTLDAPEGVVPQGGRSKLPRTAIVAVAATALVGGGVALLARDVDTTTTAADQTAESTAGQRLATDELPVDLALRFLGPVSDLGASVQVTTTDVYGLADSSPSTTGPRLTVEHIVSTGIEPIPIAGEIVDVGLGSARLLVGEPTVVIELDDSQIWVNGPGLSTSELTEIATRIEIGQDGSPDVLTALPGQLTYLDSIETGLFPGMMATVNTSGGVAAYAGDNFRHLTITTVPATEEAWLSRLWVGNFQPQTLGGRDVYMTPDEDGFNFNQILWRDEGSIVRLYASGLTDAELGDAIAGVYITSDSQSAPAVENSSATGVVVLPDLVDPTQLVADNVPAGYELVLTANHADLGSPALSATKTIYGDQTSGNLIAVRELHGQAGSTMTDQGSATTDVGGVLVTHTVGERVAKANFEHQGDLIEFTSSAITGDALLDAVAAWRSDDNPDTVAGLAVLDQQLDQVWITDSGTGVEGTAMGQTAVYAIDDATLTITTEPTERDFPISAFLDEHATVNLGITTGIYYQEDERWNLDLIVNKTLVTIATDDELSTEELLAVAASLRNATDDEWNLTSG